MPLPVIGLYDDIGAHEAAHVRIINAPLHVDELEVFHHLVVGVAPTAHVGGPCGGVGVIVPSGWVSGRSP